VAYSAAVRESLSNFEVAHILEDGDEDDNAMPKKILTKRNVFLQLIILRPHPHFTRHVCKKIRKTIRILHV